MRILATLLILACTPAIAEGPDEKEATATVQKLFDAMTAHDADAIRALLLPEARFYSIRAEGEPTNTSGEQFATRIGSVKEPIVERMWNPVVQVRGRMAQLWAPYDFKRSDKLSHCGVDTVTLFKTTAGWKIQSIAYTVEMTGCDTK